MEILESLVGQPGSLFAVLGGAVLLVLWAIRPTLPKGNRKPRGYGGSNRRWNAKGVVDPYRPAVQHPVVDAAEQLKTVMSGTFVRQRVLSQREARVFVEIEKAIAQVEKPWRVLAQVSLGEVLLSSDARACSAINSKRVDLLIVDEEYQPLAAVEYQGGGHHQGTAAARDAVKKEALRKAGVDYIEVLGGADLPIDLHRAIERLARRRTPTLA
jgi:Protein of unknown function (DUF2726)